VRKTGKRGGHFGLWYRSKISFLHPCVHSVECITTILIFDSLLPFLR